MKLFDPLVKRVLTLIEPVRELISRRTNDWLIGAMGVFILLNTALILVPLLKTAYDISTKSSVMKRDVKEIQSDKINEEKLIQNRDLKKLELNNREKLLALGDVTLYLESFSALAQETGVRLKSVRPVLPPTSKLKDVIKQDEVYRGSYFEISASAGYHEVGRFVQRIELQSAFTKIVRLSVTGTEDTPLEHDVDMLIKMIIKTDQVKDVPAEKT